MSLIFLPEGVSVGASGGIVGFLGYLAVYGFIRRKLLSDAFLKNMLFNIGFIALYGVFLNQTIDNFGHLGGLIVGAIYGFVQIPKDLHKDPREGGKATEFAGLAALGIFIAVCLFSIFLIFGVFKISLSYMPRVRVHQHVNPLSPFYCFTPKPIEIEKIFANRECPAASRHRRGARQIFVENGGDVSRNKFSRRGNPRTARD